MVKIVIWSEFTSGRVHCWYSNRFWWYAVPLTVVTHFWKSTPLVWLKINFIKVTSKQRAKKRFSMPMCQYVRMIELFHICKKCYTNMSTYLNVSWAVVKSHFLGKGQNFYLYVWFPENGLPSWLDISIARLSKQPVAVVSCRTYMCVCELGVKIFLWGKMFFF